MKNTCFIWPLIAVLSLYIYLSLIPAKVFAEIPDSVETLTETDMSGLLPYASMSMLAYEDLNSNSYFKNWKWVDSVSENGFKVSSFRNDDIRELVLSFTGTETVSDLIDDIVQASGGLDNQYNRGLSSTLAYLLNESKSQNYQVTLTGHSLGGGIAQYAAEVLGLKAFTFNPAPLNDTLLDETIVSDIIFKRQSDILNVVTYDEYKQYDVVSSLPGTLYGTTKRLSVDTSRFDIFDRHAIDTIVDTIEDMGINSNTENSNATIPYLFDKSLGPEVWLLSGNVLYSNQWFYAYQTNIENADWLPGPTLSVQGKTYSTTAQKRTYYFGANQVYYTLTPGVEMIAVWACQYTGPNATIIAGSSILMPEMDTLSTLVNADFQQTKASAYQPLIENYTNNPVSKQRTDKLHYEEILNDYHCGYLVFGGQ